MENSDLNVEFQGRKFANNKDDQVQKGNTMIPKEAQSVEENTKWELGNIVSI